MTAAEGLSLEIRADGVAVFRLDDPGRKVNVLSRALLAAFGSALDRVEADAGIRAVVLASGKPEGFVAGADLTEILAIRDAAEGEALSREAHGLLNRIAASRKPFVAAVHGAALGGGLELALACAYRLATDSPSTVLGLPEVMVGLLPAAGGTRRLPRLVGLTRALPLLLTGRHVRAKAAQRMGLVDAVTSPGGLIETAAQAARRLADGTLMPARRALPLVERIAALPFVRSLVLGRARRQARRKTRGLYPAPDAILTCVEAGLGSQAAGASTESFLFGGLVASPEAKNLIRLFLTMRSPAGPLAPVGAEPRKVQRLAVLGAGLMGEGIAAVSLGLNPVVLKDVSAEMLSKAARGIHGGLVKREKRGSLSRVERERHWHRLGLTAETRDLAGATLVIEAVFEDLELKRKVLAEVEAVIADDAVFASNTSALPIGRIAAGAKHPERVVGMHYFSPVPKMPLLEVVVAEKSAPWAVATARAYGLKQGKTVIVVKDGPGFYTSRILAPLLNEAVVVLSEGAAVEAVDDALLDFGFPVGPITLLDEVGIDVAAHVSHDLGNAFASRGLGADPLIEKLAQAGYKGRKNRKGFYRYDEAARGARRAVDASVYAYFGGPGRKPLEPRDAVDRLVLLMVNEAVHCLDEGVLASARDGDAGAILGLGFPPFRGGPFRYVDERGAASVVARLDELAGRLGKRFEPAAPLRDLARSGGRFHP